MQITDQHAELELPPEKDRDFEILTEEQRRTQFRKMLASRQTEAGRRLKEYLLAKRKQLRGLDEIPRRKRAEDTDLICRYFNGDQYGYYDQLGIYNDDRQEGDFAYTLPIISGHIEQAFIQMLKVRPTYELESDNNDDQTMVLVARMCDSIGPKELIRLISKVAHSELYNLLLHGESYRVIGWEPDPLSPKTVLRPKTVTKQIDLAGRRECAQCQTQLKDEAKCPKCGSAEIAETKGGQTSSTSIDGYEEVKLGQNSIHVPHMLSVQRDMSALEPEESTFVIEYGYMDKHVAEWKFQSMIAPSTLPLPIEMQLRFDLERSSTQIDAIVGTARLAPPGRESGFGIGAGGSSAALNRKQPVEVHYWNAAEYGAFLCTVDEQLPKKLADGRDRIPAQTLLGDFFPEDVKVLFVGDTIMDIQPCRIARKITVIRYGRVAGTNSGAGLKKLMPLQDAENDNFNLKQTIKHTQGHPLTVFNGHYVDQLPGAGNVLKIMKPGLDDIGKVVRQWPGQRMTDDGSGQIIEGAMQFIGGTNTVGGGAVAGAPDMRAAGTATGIAAMQEQAAARQSGPVDQRIEGDKNCIYQILENIQEFSTEEQFAELAKQWGPDVVAAFRKLNIRQSININIKPNTEMPKSMALNQANYIAFGQALGQVLPMIPEFPWLMEFLGDMATSMGFPFKVGEGRNDRREAQFRLNLVSAIEEEINAAGQIVLPSQPQPQVDPNIPPEQVPPMVVPLAEANPIMIAAAIHAKLSEQCLPLIPPDDGGNELGDVPDDMDIPRIFLQNHREFMDVYKDALFGEQAKSWSEARKLVVIQLWLDHLKADMSKEATMATLQGQLEAAMNPQPPPAPGSTPEEQESAADADKERESGMKDEDADREEAAAQAEHGRKKELQDQKGKQQMQLAAAKNGAKPLDEETARQLLAAAGGNKNRARQMAQAQGYTIQ